MKNHSRFLPAALAAFAAFSLGAFADETAAPAPAPEAVTEPVSGAVDSVVEAAQDVVAAVVGAEETPAEAAAEESAEEAAEEVAETTAADEPAEEAAFAEESGEGGDVPKEEAASAVSVGIWSIIPPLVAIILALVTKEVIPSLVIGILSGTGIHVFFEKLPLVNVLTDMLDLMCKKISDNAAMVVFLCLLGALVSVITRAGGSRAYGEWAARRLRTRKGASLATVVLGMVIFIDDYFNCLTIGTVMRPVTDKYRISREKLSYLIDATAAPICIIAPVSSWAASVISYFPDDTNMTGMEAFLRAVPMNLYAILTIFMIFWISLRKRPDFGPMATAERAAEAGAKPEDDDPADPDENTIIGTVSKKGHVYDLVVPILALIVFSVFAMIFYGGYWDEPAEGEAAKTLFKAFGDTDAGQALALASMGAILVAFLLFVPRRVVSFGKFFDGIVSGIKTMVPALVILALAWTISGICRDMLLTGDYVAAQVQAANEAGVLAVGLIPAIMFVVASLLAFSTGTSWGTFGILIPIIVAVCNKVDPTLTTLALSSILAGSVLGDHCSPISDTTILASTGAQCKHIRHVATQLPYAVTVGAVCVLGYLVAGFTRSMSYGANLGCTLAVSFAALLALLLVLPKVWKGRDAA